MADIADMADRYIEDQIRLSLSTRYPEPVPRHGKNSSSECLHCGAPIPKARLEALPGCDSCVVCAERHERLQAGYGREQGASWRLRPLDDYLLGVTDG